MEIIKDAIKVSEQAKGNVQEIVLDILNNVKNRGDQAIIELTSRFDGHDLKQIPVDRKELKKAYDRVEPQTIKSLEFAAEQIRYFASQQMSCLRPVECSNIPGVTLGSRLVPIHSCGAYVPAGRYPLPSTALMSVIPAKVAGVERVAACSPPSRGFDGIHPAVLVGLDMAGVDEVYCMGGAQAIAAYAYGTDSVPAVDIIIGPGNRYVTEAKRQVSGSVGIDMLAGPSEVLIIADETADSRRVAVDLLAKCEHDPDSISILVTTSRELAAAVEKDLEEELLILKTAELARKTWEDNGIIVLVDDMEEAIAYSDKFAPEHLQVMTKNDDEIARKLRNFGSLFISTHAPVAFGDYVSGTNHTLPTMTTARFSNGVWVGTFVKMSSYQKLTTAGAGVLAPHCAHLAGVEGLFAHQRSAELRLLK